MHPKNKGMGVQISPSSCPDWKGPCMQHQLFIYILMLCMYPMYAMYIYIWSYIYTHLHIYSIYIYTNIYIYTYTTNAWALPRTATMMGNDQVISHLVPLTSMKSELSTATNKLNRLEEVAAILQAFQEIFLGRLWISPKHWGTHDGYQSRMDWFKGKLKQETIDFHTWRSWGLTCKISLKPIHWLS